MIRTLRTNCVVILLWVGLGIIDALDWLIGQLRPPYLEHRPQPHPKPRHVDLFGDSSVIVSEDVARGMREGWADIHRELR